MTTQNTKKEFVFKKYTALTCDTLRRFEQNFKTEQYTEEQLNKIEFDAYVANMNRSDEEEIFAWFLYCITEVDHIAVEPIGAELDEEAIEEAVAEEVEKKMKAEQTIEAIRAEVTKRTGRSAWSKGVAQYAGELIDEIEQGIMDGYFDADDLNAPKLVERQMLNGADSWSQYSWGGSSLIYDGQIAERLCNPSELKRTRNGQRRPNSREEWLDTQARALYQASELVKTAVCYVCC